MEANEWHISTSFCCGRPELSLTWEFWETTQKTPQSYASREVRRVDIYAFTPCLFGGELLLGALTFHIPSLPCVKAKCVYDVFRERVKVIHRRQPVRRGTC